MLTKQSKDIILVGRNKFRTGVSSFGKIAGQSMNDYSEMRKRLEGMTDRDFQSLLSDLYDIELFEDDKSSYEYEQTTGASRLILPSENWRQDWTQDILAFKRTKPEAWDRVCSELGILEDSIRTMYLARRSNCIAIIAIILAVVANIENLSKLLNWLKSLIF